jgi:hypothetical protein
MRKLFLNPFASSPTTRTRWLPEIGDHLRPTFQRIADGLQLVRHARSEATENRPHKDDTDLDEPQRQVVSEIQTGANLLRQFLTNQLHDAEERIRARLPHTLDVALAVAQARASAAEAKLTHAAVLEGKRLSERRRLRGLRKFKLDNRLTRDAAYADDWLMPAAILFTIFVVESAANAFIFREAVDLGLAGGFVLAALFGLVNVFLGFGTGVLGLRLLGHISWPIKLVGTATALVTSIVGCTWNMLIAHFRETLERGAAVTSFLDSEFLITPSRWLTFASLESSALFLLGNGVFVIAALKGRGGRGGFADPYWGYRAIDLTHRETEAEYTEAQEHYKAAVRNAYDEARAKLRDQHANDLSALQEIREIANQAEQRTAEVRDSLGEWSGMGGALLRLYREENQAIRTAPAPSYFARYPSFEDVTHGLMDASNIRAVAELAGEMHCANSTALAAIEERISEMKQQETKNFLSEIHDIESRAERRLASDWSESLVAPAPGAD